MWGRGMLEAALDWRVGEVFGFVEAEKVWSRWQLD